MSLPPGVFLALREPEDARFYPSVIPVQSFAPAVSAKVWLDTSTVPPVLKGWDGAAWVGFASFGADLEDVVVSSLVSDGASSTRDSLEAWVDPRVTALGDARWQRNLDVVTPQMFGAAGNGLADDTAGVQAFFDHLSANGGHGFAEGTFRVTSLISIDRPAKSFTFRGAGRTAAKFVSVTGVAGNAFFIREAKNCTFEGFTLDAGRAANASQSHGISAQNCDSVTFRDIDVTNYGDTAILVMMNPSFTGPSVNNRIIDCNAYGLNLANNGFMLETSSGSSMENCNVYSLNKSGSPSYGLQIKNASTDCSIIGGAVDGANAGVAFGNTTTEVAEDCLVTGVRVSNSNYGILMGYSRRCRIDAQIDMGSLSTGIQAVRVGANCEFNQIDATVSNTHLNTTVCYIGHHDNHVRIGTVANMGGNLLELNAGVQRNTLVVGKVIGYTGLTDPLLKVVDNSGQTNNFLRYEMDTAELCALATNASTLRFSGSSGRSNWLQYSHVNNLFTFRVAGTDRLSLSGTYLRPGVDNAQSLGDVNRRWTEVWAKNGIVLASPNGTKYRLTVSDTGTLSAVVVP